MAEPRPACPGAWPARNTGNRTASFVLTTRRSPRTFAAMRTQPKAARTAFELAHGKPMHRTVHCAKLGIDAEGLDFAPWPGPLGQRVYEHISRQAWQQWLAHQTMLINEYRLNPLEAKTRQFLSEQMEKYFFGGDVAQPAGYVAPDEP